MTRVLFLPISGRQGASSRYRVYQFIPLLEAADISMDVMTPEPKARGLMRPIKGWYEERACLKAAEGADIIFIQKRLFPVGFIQSLRRLGKKIVFDLDDSIFTSPKMDWSGPTRAKVLARLSAVLEASDLVIAGNRFLASKTREIGARRVEVLPTCLDLSGYRAREHRQGPPVVGWIGSSVNHFYLDNLSGVMRGLSGEFPGLRLLVVSDKEYRMDGVEVENSRWSEGSEIDDLLRMDVGLMPLADDDWTRGKCAFKAIQYMACGIPSVCSPVGANIELVEDGVDGFLPKDESGWFDALAALLSSPEKRAGMGRAAYGKIESEYSLAAVGPGFVGLLRGI